MQVWNSLCYFPCKRILLTLLVLLIAFTLRRNKSQLSPTPSIIAEGDGSQTITEDSTVVADESEDVKGDVAMPIVIGAIDLHIECCQYGYDNLSKQKPQGLDKISNPIALSITRRFDCVDNHRKSIPSLEVFHHRQLNCL
ncbi:hypothetical protein BDF21DRAFT_402404 [Thamnidium elegans]|nr:hypothetical protein BDF21DRAFT_402404 [Thamnidium elegans]